MLTLRNIHPEAVQSLLPGAPDRGRMTPQEWEAFVHRASPVAFVAEEEGKMVGFVFAESHPTLVHVLFLEGTAVACRLLLERIVRLAGERNMAGRFPIDRPDLLAILDLAGFKRRFKDEFWGRPSYFCERRLTDEEE
jgi:hypothetical protein